MDISSDTLARLLTKDLDTAKKEKLSLSAQNNTIKSKQIKAEIDNEYQNSKYMLNGERDETINYRISECSKLTQKEYKTRHNCVGEDDSLGIVQKIKIWPYYQMVYAQTRIHPKEWDAYNSLRSFFFFFLDTNGSPNSGRRGLIHKRKKNLSPSRFYRSI